MGRHGTRSRHPRKRRSGSWTGALLRRLFEFTLIVIVLAFLASLLGLLEVRPRHSKQEAKAETSWDPRKTEMLPAVVSELAGGSREARPGALDEADVTSWEGRIEETDGGRAIRVHVANGCKADKLAGRAREAFRQAGFDVRGISNADEPDYRETVVVDRTGNQRVGQAVLSFVQKRWGVGRLVLQERPSDAVEVVVVLGSDIAERISAEPEAAGGRP